MFRRRAIGRGVFALDEGPLVGDMLGLLLGEMLGLALGDEIGRLLLGQPRRRSSAYGGRGRSRSPVSCGSLLLLILPTMPRM
jgi:hypothetical protein